MPFGMPPENETVVQTLQDLSGVASTDCTLLKPDMPRNTVAPEAMTTLPLREMSGTSSVIAPAVTRTRVSGPTFIAWITMRT